MFFHKMHGLGNDFVVIDLRDQEWTVDADTARTLAHRRLGIGCDQVLLLDIAGADSVAGYRVFNADGSTAQQCGNGVRCLAEYLRRRGELHREAVLDGPAGPVPVQVHGPGDITATLESPRPAEAQAPEYDLVRLGNDHAVVWVDHEPRADLERASQIRQDPRFKDGANVGFAQRENSSRLRLTVVERGAGPTRACGSGACAAAIAGLRAGKLVNPVTIAQPGGELTIDWPGEGEPVAMRGPANHVFSGQWE